VCDKTQHQHAKVIDANSNLLRLSALILGCEMEGRKHPFTTRPADKAMMLLE
jgi:hypothetical protein